ASLVFGRPPRPERPAGSRGSPPPAPTCYAYETRSMSRSKNPRSASSARSSRSWDPVADWYVRWTGKRGGKHHRRTAIPAVLDLLDLQPGERVLDLGCSPGAL